MVRSGRVAILFTPRAGDVAPGQIRAHAEVRTVAADDDAAHRVGLVAPGEGGAHVLAHLELPRVALPRAVEQDHGDTTVEEDLDGFELGRPDSHGTSRMP